MIAFMLASIFVSATLADQFANCGSNADIRHCEGARDVETLFHTPQLPPAAALRTHVDLRYDERRALLIFAVTVPYLAYDVHYTVDFIGSQPGVDDPCSTDYRHHYHSVDTAATSGVSDDDGDDNTTYSRWSHAPNAKYAGAFASHHNYTTYHIDRLAYWRPRPRGCSHVVYEAALSPDDCVNFAPPSTNIDDSVRRVAGSLRITLVRAPDASVHLQEVVHFALYVDRAGNRVLLQSELPLDLDLLVLERDDLTDNSSKDDDDDDDHQRNHRGHGDAPPMQRLEVLLEYDARAFPELVGNATNGTSERWPRLETLYSVERNDNHFPLRADVRGTSNNTVRLLGEAHASLSVPHGRYVLVFAGGGISDNETATAHVAIDFAEARDFSVVDVPQTLFADRVCFQTQVRPTDGKRVISAFLLLAELCANDETAGGCRTLFDAGDDVYGAAFNTTVKRSHSVAGAVNLCFDDAAASYNAHSEYYLATVHFIAVDGTAKISLTATSTPDPFGLINLDGAAEPVPNYASFVIDAAVVSIDSRDTTKRKRDVSNRESDDEGDDNDGDVFLIPLSSSEMAISVVCVGLLILIALGIPCCTRREEYDMLGQ